MKKIRRFTVIGVSAMLFWSAVYANGQYFALCDEQHGLILGWTGPTRDTYEEAQEDADAHTKKFGHEATVVQ